MNNYGIFFTKDKTVIRLPINPEVLPDSLEGNNETYNILGIGEVTVPRRPKQRKVELSSYFPATPTYNVLTPNKFMVPEEYIQFFRDAMENKTILTYTPVRYTEDGKAFGTSDPGFKCTVENFDVEERGGETGDFYYTLSIKEYRDYSPQTVKVQVVKKQTTEKKVVTKTATRDVPQDEIVVGTQVEVNGPVYQQLTTAPETPTQTTGQQATVARISHVTANPYLLKSTSGNTIGWVPKTALTPVKTIIQNEKRSQEHLNFLNNVI